MAAIGSKDEEYGKCALALENEKTTEPSFKVSETFVKMYKHNVCVLFEENNDDWNGKISDDADRPCKTIVIMAKCYNKSKQKTDWLDKIRIPHGKDIYVRSES